MSYCINPTCLHFDNPANQLACPSCGPEILVTGRYRVIKRLDKGGFAHTFEVEDTCRGGTRKVLKVLHIDCDKAICLFQREAEVLKQLNYQGIPRVESDGYFKIDLVNSNKPLHCLVMEKIEGSNLRDWLNQNNKPITQQQACEWLKQITEILNKIHQHNYFHRDIKPSNIMLQPDNQLVLIDFGAVREATETYLYNLQRKGCTVIISRGYTPPEQVSGRAVLASDFYALGRTFVHLLTGISPDLLPEDSETGRLIWRNKAPQVLPKLADLIDDMMAPLPPYSIKRPRNAHEILQRLKQIETRTSRSFQLMQPSRKPPIPPSSNNINEETTTLVKPQNKKLTLAILAGAILLSAIAAIIYIINLPKACDKIIGDNLSCGEEVLVPDSEVSFKQQGVQKIKEGKYAEAVSLLKKAREEQPSDPETLIYLNNAQLGNQKAYTIAVVAPIGKSSDTAMEMMRGVAQSQNEINQGKKINGIGLKVLIADDANNPKQAQEVANKLVKRGDILAVVGHYASEVTLAAVPVYQEHKLVVISPGSTSEELSRWGDIPNHVFFRTVPNTRVAAQYLASYLLAQSRDQQAAVFYAPGSNFSRSLREQFLISFTASGGKVVAEVDLSKQQFNASAAIAQAHRQKATALGVFPDGGTTAFGISNTLRLIRANRGDYWIVGGSTLYSPDTLLLLGKDALNRFVVVVTWHHLESHDNPEFPQAARNLWRGDVSWRTATAYDATRALIIALEKQSSPSRVSLQQALADKNFKAQGATGTISFRGGDRNEPISTLVKVVRANCSTDSYIFVPVNHPPPKANSLENCKK